MGHNVSLAIRRKGRGSVRVCVGCNHYRYLRHGLSRCSPCSAKYTKAVLGTGRADDYDTELLERIRSLPPLRPVVVPVFIPPAKPIWIFRTLDWVDSRGTLWMILFWVSMTAYLLTR